MQATQAAGQSTVWDLFADRARRAPDAIALDCLEAGLTSYDELASRARALAGVFEARGIARGDRVAILSENCRDYITAELACALLGAILACQNWRLVPSELDHCLTLVSPKLLMVSERHAELAAQVTAIPLLTIGPELDSLIDRATPATQNPDVTPEDGLVILYTSGTTGLPKGALISHRAMIARMSVLRLDGGTLAGDGFIAWAPMFHMASTDQQLGALMSGTTVVVIDGPDMAAILTGLSRYPIGWFVMMPGVIETFIEAYRSSGIVAKGITVVGAMADLVPRAQIAELTEMLDAPYFNSFGATETGAPPASANMLAPGDADYSLSKQISSLCQIKLVDPEGIEVPDGSPGELAIKGPTVFSGYWNAPETNAKDFKGGWFHMGDLFARNPNGTLDFVDRAKYLIKSGGENIYPAEIERVLLADPRINDAVVVRKPDPKWGETPVAFVALNEPMTPAQVLKLCETTLARYKRPSEVHFIAHDKIPRSTTGKIQRHEIEATLL